MLVNNSLFKTPGWAQSWPFFKKN